jgi:hypothetical protein
LRRVIAEINANSSRKRLRVFVRVCSCDMNVPVRLVRDQRGERNTRTAGEENLRGIQEITSLT